jgi:PAS domain S-box-containing protein
MTPAGRPGRARRGIRWWLVTVASLALIPLLVFAAACVLWLVDRERSALVETLREQARALALATDQQLEGSIAALQGIATARTLASGNYAAFRDQLETVRAKLNRVWWTAGVLDSAGRVVLSLEPPINEVAASIVQRGDFRAAVAANRPWISDAIVDARAQPTILIAVPAGRDGAPGPVLVAAVRTEALAMVLAQHRLPEGASAYVLDRQNAVVVRLPGEGPDQATPLHEGLMRNQQRAWDGFARLPSAAGQSVYAAFTRSPTSNWTVTLVVPEAAFNAPWRRWLWTVVGGGLLLLLLGVGLASLVARRIARAIVALSAAARALGRGEVPRADAFGIAEVDEVGQAIAEAAVARQRAEEALRRSEAWLHTTLRGIGDAVLATDTNGRVTFMNPVAESMTGWTLHEAAGQPLDRIFVISNEATREREETPVAKVLREGAVVGLGSHAILTSREGTETPIDDSAAPIRDEAGRAIGVVLVFRDVTERRHTEHMLRTSEARYRAIVEDQTELVCRFSPSGRLTFVNEACERYFGRPRDALQGESFIALLHPEDRERVAKNLALLGPSQVTVNIESRIVGRDGQIGWTQWTTHAIVEGDGPVMEVQAVGRDITGRKMVEQALARITEDLAGRARRQAAVAQLGQRALAGTDLATLQEEAAKLLCEALGAEFCRVLELSGDGQRLELRAKVGWPVGSPLVVPATGSEAEQALSNLEPVIIEDLEADQRFRGDPLLRRAGIVSGMSVMILGHPRPYGLLSVHTTNRRTFTPDDVNFLHSVANVLATAIARARAETERAELLRRAQEAQASAEQANRAKDEFLAMLGHELRNPLAAIVNAGRVLEQTRTEDDRTIQLGSIIARQSGHLSRMVDDLLDVSRLGSGKIALRREPVDLKDVVERSVGSFRDAGRIERHHLAVEAESVPVFGDPTRLEQIVWNLLDNALKYTPPGGRIVVAVSRDRNTALLRVRDTGVGIHPDILTHVFDLFVQARPSLDRAQGGLGLGLTLVRRLVELHGGAVSAFSDGPGQGSEFVVRLPATVATTPAALVPPAPTVRERRRVLLVEDNPDTREALAILLESWGHQVEQVGDGASAAAAVAAAPPEFALVDVGLPDMDGYVVAQRLRAIPASADIVLVALTGYSREDDRRRAREAGFDAYLVKPVDPDALMRILDGNSPPARDL